MSAIADQQFVAHLFVPARGPGAKAGFRAVEEVWRGCALRLLMTEPIPGTNLPSLLEPGIRDMLPPDGELAIAAQERPGANCQAVLRLHHDLLNLSVALAPPEASVPLIAASGEEDWPWWRKFDREWRDITALHADHLVGEARLYLARVDTRQAITAADPGLFADLSAFLPAEAADWQQSAGVSLPGDLALWETSTAPDERAMRRFVLAFAPDADEAASELAWSRGDPSIPPLARYLLHAAKLRYEMRVWRRDSNARQLRDALHAMAGELARRGTPDPARAAQFRQTRINAIRLHADLKDLQQTVEIAADNLGHGFDPTVTQVPGSPFADDAGLARYLLQQLDDEAGYLGRAAELAERVAREVPVPIVPPPVPDLDDAGRDQPREDMAEAEPAWEGQARSQTPADRQRRIFVVYGRDEPARAAIFAFLLAINLWPLEWEPVVAQTGKGAPYLSEAVRRGLAAAHAVVVLMTPEDIARLHPDLHGPHEPATETEDSMQARPNVLIELGMALITHPDRTLLLLAGTHRLATDLGGLNFIQLSDTDECRRKIAARLKSVGCLVDDSGNDWLKAGNFAGLAALSRRPR